ncbi:MAG TPA: hypothetical protein VLJ61_02440 [Pyrinomonadaceae bacterium]|nr:hypothetical protein [Pyrinomonadaceae bacterium]
MQPQLYEIVAGIEHREVSQLLGGVFSDLNRLLGYLDGIGATVQLGEPSSEALFLLDVIRSEGLATVGGVEYQCGLLEMPRDLSEELERVCFALRYELRTVFERILPAGAGQPDACSRLKDAHDLLRNCFQQSTISLARVFEPRLDGAQLFNDIRVKRDTSLRLYEDLGALLRSARHALWGSDPSSLWLFVERLEDFSEGTMQYLMQKDRDACAGFIEDFKTAQRFGGARSFLHRFSCYLEILLNHVGMRSVLAGVRKEMAA